MNCTTLTVAPEIPNNVTDMYRTFYGCTALTGDVVINANPTSYTECFKNTTKAITLSGSSTKLAVLAATANKGNVTVVE